MARLRATLWTLGVLLLSWPLLGASPAEAANVVLLVMDDAPASDVVGMPTMQQLAKEGVTFDRAYAPSPMCAPGRAVIQTGLYSQNNGVTQNSWQQFVASGDLTRTFAYALHEAGADTRFIGKYINGAPSAVPGWNSFIVHLGTGNAEPSNYYDYILRIDGKKVAYGHAPGDYSTDVYRGFALKDIQAALATRRPFLTMICVGAPHNPVTPPPRYLFGPGSARQRTVLGVDDALKAIVDLLKRTGRYDDTYIVLSADHGLASGRKPSKGVPYEGSIRIPFIVKGPGVKPGVTVHEMVSQADFAPTFLDWLGAPAMAVDGRSLVPLLGGNPPVAWRQALGIGHAYMGSAPTVPSWRGVRTLQYAYVEYDNGARELYDMIADPRQLRNIAGTADPSLRARLSGLAAALAKCAGDSCRRLEQTDPDPRAAPVVRGG